MREYRPRDIQLIECTPSKIIRTPSILSYHSNHLQQLKKIHPALNFIEEGTVASISMQKHFLLLEVPLYSANVGPYKPKQKVELLQRFAERT